MFLYCCVSIHLKTCLRQRFLCTGFCQAGFSWAVLLISPEVTHIPYSHWEEAGEPRWLCSHLWLFNWDGSSMLGSPGISFFNGVPPAGWLGIFLWWLKMPQSGSGGSQYSTSQAHDWCNTTFAAVYWSKHIKGPTRIQGEGNLTPPWKKLWNISAMISSPLHHD